MRTFYWVIEDVVAAHPNLYLEHCAVMACALMRRQTTAAGQFLVECEGFSPPTLAGERQFQVEVAWGEQTAVKADRVWYSEQAKAIMERAAIALAALAFAKLIPGGDMRVTMQGERADYWL